MLISNICKWPWTNMCIFYFTLQKSTFLIKFYIQNDITKANLKFLFSRLWNYSDFFFILEEGCQNFTIRFDTRPSHSGSGSRLPSGSPCRYIKSNSGYSRPDKPGVDPAKQASKPHLQIRTSLWSAGIFRVIKFPARNSAQRITGSELRAEKGRRGTEEGRRWAESKG